MTYGLTPRVVVASGLLALVIGAAFAILLAAVADMRDSAQRARHSLVELATANQLEKLLIDIETGQRGFLITGDQRFLQPWDVARKRFPEEARKLAALTDDPGQARLARQIGDAGIAYIDDYSVPLVRAARRNDPAARGVASAAEGKRRVDALRSRFARYEGTERDLADADQELSDAQSRRAVVAGTAGLTGSVILILLFAAYLLRAIVLPVRRAADMAGRLAGGDLAVRMPETAPGEIGDLERSFNSMAGSLQASRDSLRLVAEEQAALRRVATLVAQRASPSELFGAVAKEAGSLLDADSTRLLRYETDGTAVVVADHSEPGLAVPLGREVPLDGDSDFPGLSAALMREMGLRSGVARGILVEGRLWGMIAAAWRQPRASEDAETRLEEFSRLVGTAIANADSRAELAASRARVVAAGDETRRRIERDLHDGAQQRLVSLGLQLRAAEATVPAGLDDLKGRLADAAKGLASVVEDLQEMSRGIHPAILSQGGLGPALKALARRSAIPVEISMSDHPPLPERVEVAGYYVVSEALTNAVKHARATSVSVALSAGDGVVRFTIRDDGVGGADPRRGSGLVGLRDRVEALGGTIAIASPAGAGTSLQVEIPVDQPNRADSGSPPSL